MLVCPHCQFENPDNHKFCQQCGVSLTERECPACGAWVAFDLEHCPKCGTSTGMVWRAIVTPAAAGWKPSPESQPAPIEAGPQTQLQTAVNAASLPSFGKFLDAEQRYQLLDVSPLAEAPELEARVLDRQPFQPSLLEVLCHQPPDLLTNAKPEAPALISVPALAQPYLTLQANHPSLPLPKIHDAWERDGLSVVLLEDRTGLPSLLELWRDDTIFPLQILHWLREMLEFWLALSPQQCCRSLLELDNLRVDEDYLLCLQRLYPDQPDHPPALRDLGVVWQELFQQSQRTQNGEIARLCLDLEAGTVRSLSDLRSRIEAIAITLQPHSGLTSMTSPSSEPLGPNLPDSVSQANAAAGQELDGSPSLEPASDPGDASEDTEPIAYLTFSDEEGITESDDLPTIVLPMRLVSLEDAGRTDIGRQREHNEDCFTIQTDLKKLESPQGRVCSAKGLYILCDGMGGHAGGEVASALAVDTLRKYFEANWHDKLPSEASIQAAIQEANRAIYHLNQKNARSGSGRMGTTLVLVLIHNTEAAIAHVGDSRLYRFSRRLGLEQVTVDHEVGQREIQRGVEPTIAYARPDAYQLTQALGPRDENFINPDIKFLELNEDMLLLLCSDGLTDNNLLETHWRTHLDPLLSSQTNLDAGVSQLIELANQYNGHDNITVVAIRAKVRPNLDQLNLG